MEPVKVVLAKGRPMSSTTTSPTDQTSPTTDVLDIAAVVDAVRARSPLVHCVTNTVVTNFTANALLAAGAAPAMVDAPEEAGILASVAGALLINLGTVTTAQSAGMRA